MDITKTAFITRFTQKHKEQFKVALFIYIVLRITPRGLSDYFRKSIASLLRTIATVIDVSYILPVESIIITSPSSPKRKKIPTKVTFRVSEEVTIKPPQSLASRFSPHRHTPSIDRAIALTNSLQDVNAWTFLNLKEQVSIYTRQTDIITLPFVRGLGTFSGFSIIEWVSVIKSGVARNEWDTRFLSSNIVEAMNPSDTLALSVQKGMYTVAAREFLVVQTNIIDSDQRTYLLMTSVVDDISPVDLNSGRVRAELVLGAWILEKVDDEVRVDYIVGVDFKGNVPEYIVKTVQGGTPMCIMNVYKYLKVHGSVPFILRHDAACPDFSLSTNISITKELFDQQTKEIKIEYRIKKLAGTMTDKRAQVTIVLSKAYDEGVEIQAATRGKPLVVLGGSMFQRGSVSVHRIVQIWMDIKDCDGVDEEFKLDIKPSRTGHCILNGNIAE